ncbi:FAD-dependent monooxygenase [Frankia sp. AgKG'84/4]|uniref:FAD-dependent monooxygenase n=1 Tax=Frankia sp. AgKG'84/4 TaxID=573490 RepID=UPI00200FBA94|nr:FAD-dependent monooxygenase [Frankia sp. AgKG'84/4]MCL9793366.1 FAD-dependent monooxygenase [Frankia sp. AgKG'84/4]
MSAVTSVLVVGGGVSGAAVAILLAEAGVAVELVEIKPELTAVGSGITLQGNALRVLRQLGVLESCAALGYESMKLVVRAPDPRATIVAELDDIPFGGPDLPSSMGMYRPDLARILMDRAEQAGVKIRYSTTTESLEQDGAGVEVRFSTGSSGRYDLVIGADGVRSWTRRMLEIPLETRSLGMGAWRMVGPRPADVTSSQAVFGGPCYIAGVTPTSATSAYWFLVEPAQDRTAQTPREQLADFLELFGAYHGPWDEVRSAFTDPQHLNYTWFEAHLLAAPWNRGRVVLIGDAVHVCPPTLAQGAAAGLEDAAVLAELLTTSTAVDDRLWAAFTARRYERVKMVVDASVQMAQWNLDHVQGDVPGLTRTIAALVSQPA